MQHASGVIVTPLLRRILLALWQHRQLDRQQMAAWFYPHLPADSSLIGRDLRKWVGAGFLYARPRPIERELGRPPLVYALGAEAPAVVSAALALPLEVVRARQKRDVTLTWLFWRHRAALVDVHTVLARACAARGFALQWTGDDELAARKLATRVDGKPAPLRPDGYLVVTTGERTVARFLELQVASEPRAYRLKADAYTAFYTSGAYTQQFGFKGMRVLALVESAQRAANLVAAVSPLPHPELFYATTLAQFTADPFGAIWSVPTSAEPLSLLA